MFAIFGAIGVAQNVKLPDGIDPQQLLARAARLHIILGSACVFDTIEQKEILLRPITHDGKHIAHGGVGDAHASRFLRGKIDDSGIQCQQFVVTPAIQRKVLDLLFRDHAGNVCCGRAYRRRFLGYGYSLLDLADLQSEIHGCLLVYGQMKAATQRLLKSVLLHA